VSPRAAARLESLGFTHVYDYVPGKTDWLAAGLPREGQAASVPLAGDVLQDVPLCNPDERLGAVRERIGPHADICAVVDGNGILLGLLRAKQLKSSRDGVVEEAMIAGPTTVRASEMLDDLVGRMNEHDVTAILVTTPEGRPLGLLRRAEAERVLAQRKRQP